MKTLDEKPDSLLRRAMRGDERAFLALYEKHQSALYRYALRMTGSPWAAEEVVQEVFLLLIREPHKFQPDRGELGAFLFGVTRNRVMKHLERLPREDSLDEINANGTAWRVGTIRSRLHRGRALLLAKLELLRDAPRRASAGAR